MNRKMMLYALLYVTIHNTHIKVRYAFINPIKAINVSKFKSVVSFISITPFDNR